MGWATFWATSLQTHLVALNSAVFFSFVSNFRSTVISSCLDPWLLSYQGAFLFLKKMKKWSSDLSAEIFCPQSFDSLWNKFA
jgi:hypothetical protein